MRSNYPSPSYSSPARGEESGRGGGLILPRKGRGMLRDGLILSHKGAREMEERRKLSGLLY
jgi:hypothetical protein